MIKLIKSFFLVFLCISVHAQLPADMSRIKSSDISDAQLQEFVQKAQASGQSETQIVQEFSRRGMPASEISAIRTRLASLASSAPISSSNVQVQSRTIVPQKATTQQAENGSLIFGSELFSNPSLSFEPDLRIPTPKNYVLGPDDQLMLDVYGINLSQQALKVSSEGSVYIKYGGPVQVSGLTIEEATKVINKKLSKFYPAIANGQTSVQLTVTGIRSIKIIIIGAVKKPGTYNLTSLSTLFNALYVSGGPKENGSFRNIELIRNNKQVIKADLYEFLINSSQKSNVRLMDNDVIKIPFVQNKILLKGELNREGFFEMQPSETLEDAISFAGGFRSNAFKARITGIRNGDFDRAVLDIPKDSIKNFKPFNGDEYTVGGLIDKFQNRITINGAVFKPGSYSLEKGITINSLLQKAQGLREDAYTGRAILTRTREDLTKEYLSINLTSDSGKNILLQKEDVIDISSIFDIKDKFTVSINGAVRNPNAFPFEDSLSLKSLILMAGGFADNATGKGIEISRRKRDVDVNNPLSPIVEIIAIDDTKDLSKIAADIKLKPFDVVTVKVDPYYKAQITVSINGEILNPGVYTLTSRSEKVSDLLKRAGNVLYTANIAGAKLVRRNYYGNTDLEVVEKIAASSAKDSSGVILEQERKPYREVSIALTKIMNSPGSKEDILLEEGDQIIIPAIDNMVSVSGEVFKPLSLSFEKSKNLRDYLYDAGGITKSGNKKRIFVVYPNGKAATTKHVLLIFRKYPEITAGCKIFVPKEPEKKEADYSRVGIIVAGFSAIITTMALVYQITK
jgi:protein involved in polysaccharide export with SLBB domain